MFVSFFITLMSLFPKSIEKSISLMYNENICVSWEITRKIHLKDIGERHKFFCASLCFFVK